MDKRKEKILLYTLTGLGVALGAYAAYQLIGNNKRSYIAIDPRVGASVQDIKSIQDKNFINQQPSITALFRKS